MEPQACAARVEPDGKLTVWTSAQGHFTVRNQLVALLDLPASRLNVIPMEIGGGFGGKALALFEPTVATLAQKTGRPVKLVISREEVLRATGPGSPAVITVKAGAKKDGHLTAASAIMRVRRRGVSRLAGLARPAGRPGAVQAGQSARRGL